MGITKLPTNFYAPLNSRRKNALKKRLPQVCVYCGSTQNLTLDHILARMLGGSNRFSNLQMLCFKCNNNKAKGESIIAIYLRMNNKLSKPSELWTL